ncbi:MAG: helix-turn-helix domain-containing protein [Marinicellaceae bacterium]
MEKLDIGWRSALLFSLYLPMILLVIKLLFKSTEKSASKALAGFVFFFSLTTIPQIIGFMNAYEIWPGLTFAPFNLELLLGPFLLLHVHFLTSQKSTGSIKLLFIPGFIQFIYYVFVFTYFDDYRDKWQYNEQFHQPYIIHFEVLFISIISLYCGYQCWIKIKTYQLFLSDTQSNTESFDPKWLKYFLFAFFSLVLIWLGFELSKLIIAPINYVSQYPIHLLMSLLVLWMAQEGLCHLYEHFPKPDAEANSIELSNNDQDWGTLVQKIIKTVNKNELYLQPKLTVSQLAKILGTNDSYISRALNENLQMNFNTFINKERINHAKKCIRSEADSSLLDIALKAGFSSKSTFNRMFKQFEGQTPSQFKNITH